MEDTDFIRTCECDECHRRGPTVVMHHHGEEAAALCAACAPRPFESVARRDIDRWLGVSNRDTCS